MPLTFGSLFAGIGGFDLGFERAGMVCKWQVEKDLFCQKVLAKHWPNVERFGDVKEVGKHNLEPVDVICGGFPCQPHSTAGKRKASADERDLWGEYARIIGEIKPRWIVAENVPGLLSSEAGQFFGRVLRDLAQMGYDAEWISLSASEFGFDHKRERVFILAYPKSLGWEGDNNIQASLGCIKARIFPEFIGSGFAERESRRSVKPSVGRVAYGVSQKVDRLRSLGNAVVPQVAEFIATLLIRAYNKSLERNY